MGFVGNYVPCGLSPQTDGMPVIQKHQRPSNGGRCRCNQDQAYQYLLIYVSPLLPSGIPWSIHLITRLRCSALQQLPFQGFAYYGLC